MRLRLAVRLTLGAAALGLMAWQLDVRVVHTALTAVGWGMALIVGQELVAHLFNALGWRFAFAPGEARGYPLGELVRLRVAGDAVNYLTPTATLGGEVARVAMLGAARARDTGAVSVIVAKSTQTLAQAGFITAGLLLVASEWLPVLRSALPWGMVTVALGALGLYGFRSSCRAAASWVWRRAFGGRVVAFLRRHPGRVALSTLMFALGYAWGVFEAYWICRCLGVPVPIVTAVALEVLSITVDGLLFVVPAKIGTQEGGKVAVFALLGLPLTSGLAFGITRHVRELAWAALGVLLCYAAVGRDATFFRRPAVDGSAPPTGFWR